MKSILVFLASVCISATAMANDFALGVGFRNTNVDAKTTGVSTSANNGFQLGGLAFIDLADAFKFRTGFFYTQRYAKYGSSPETEINYTYIDIPLTVLYKFSDFGGAFAGPVIAMNQSKEYKASSGTATPSGVSSMIVPIAIGLSFKFAPQIGGELFYEMGGGKIDDNFENFKSVGANFVVYFD